MHRALISSKKSNLWDIKLNFLLIQHPEKAFKDLDTKIMKKQFSCLQVMLWWNTEQLHIISVDGNHLFPEGEGVSRYKYEIFPPIAADICAG